MTGVIALFLAASALAQAGAAAIDYSAKIQPLLEDFCYNCHGDGESKGHVAFDAFTSHPARLEDRELWLKVLKNLQSGTMPPPKKARPSAEEATLIENWIRSEVFKIDPQNPDPGRVTVRRLNRVEYRNTIRDLMGVEFDTSLEFPADDTGHGFDNIADVLTLSPMLLEKYLDAARTIVTRAVPVVPRVPAERVIDGQALQGKGRGSLTLSYYKPASHSHTFQVDRAGRYEVILDLTTSERFVDDMFDYNKCELVFKIDGEQVLRREFAREGGKPFSFEFPREWQAGEHHVALEITPLTPEAKQVRSLALRITSVTLRGPLDEAAYVRPKNYERFFGADADRATETDTNVAARDARAREVLRRFATKAFRRPVDASREDPTASEVNAGTPRFGRPVDDATVTRLVSLAATIYAQPGRTFEAGIAHAMVAVLASPRFIFREEQSDAPAAPGRHPFVDEHTLASRLSYFLWSTMPDDELRRLADAGQLRANQAAQIERMLADRKSEAFVRNFTGQWLHARDIEDAPIDSRAVLAREEKRDPARDKARARFRELRSKPDESLTAAEKEEITKLRSEVFGAFRRGRNVDFNGELKGAMRRETEKVFEHVFREDRPLTELLDSDYTFLNERLATHYGIPDVKGSEMRRVQLPEGSPRGGVLTQGTILAVTSNPTRTSPVKRGVFILENILGMPPPPPPPDIPSLEESGRRAGRELTLRETLELHRQQPLCSSCHDRMDPLGLALENFNALGMWRVAERESPVEPAGELITGEKFQDIRELKRILATGHREEFYRCVTEKLLTYALGRGLEYYDVATVDDIVERIEKADGRFSALLLGVLESAPFQKRRAQRKGSVAVTSATAP